MSSGMRAACPRRCGRSEPNHESQAAPPCRYTYTYVYYSLWNAARRWRPPSAPTAVAARPPTGWSSPGGVRIRRRRMLRSDSASQEQLLRGRGTENERARLRGWGLSLQALATSWFVLIVSSCASCASCAAGTPRSRSGARIEVQECCAPASLFRACKTQAAAPPPPPLRGAK
jgi:hypothetical protein